jgi:hypothetical protein
MNAGSIGKAPGWELYLISAICVAAAVLFLESEVPPATRPPAFARPAVPTQEPATVHSLPVSSLPVQVAMEEAGLSTQPSLNQTMELIHSKLREWSERKTGDRETDDRLMNELNALLNDDNAQSIIKALTPEELHGPFGTSALFHWMHLDPVTAANWIAARPDSTDDQAWVVAHNLQAAGIDLQEYGNELPDSKWKQSYLLDAGLAVLSSNPGEVIGLAQQMRPGDEQTNLLQTAVNDWMTSDPAMTKSWVMSITDPALRDQLIAAASKSYASTNPREAAAWVVSVMAPGDNLDNTLVSILSNWSTSNPVEAANWVSALPAGPMQNSAVGAVLGQWMQSDSPSATAWAQRFPGGSDILAKLNSTQQ